MKNTNTNTKANSNYCLKKIGSVDLLKVLLNELLSQDRLVEDKEIYHLLPYLSWKINTNENTKKYHGEHVAYEEGFIFFLNTVDEKISMFELDEGYFRFHSSFKIDKSEIEQVKLKLVEIEIASKNK